MRLILSLFLCLWLVSCGNVPYRGCEVVGADDFVMDSYRIREGKIAILEMEGKCLEPLREELFESERDLIHEGDILNVVVYHPTRADLTGAVEGINRGIGFQVNGGQIKLPDLCPLRVEGLTLPEAKELIQTEYSIQDVEVFVTYRERPHQKVELMGMVNLSSVAVREGTRLFDVLSQAQVPPQANLFKSYVVRGGRILPVDLTRLVREGDMSQNIAMHGGDKIFVAETSASPIMVLGEVGRERIIDVPSGSMTLRQALAEAGGIPYTGDKRYIQVIRGSLLCPKIYSLNWEHVIRLPNDSLLLIPGDMVYVAAKPIADWNRFVNQVLPTLIGVDILTRGAKNVGFNIP